VGLTNAELVRIKSLRERRDFLKGDIRETAGLVAKLDSEIDAILDRATNRWASGCMSAAHGVRHFS
jgi:hypothetical protein